MENQDVWITVLPEMLMREVGTGLHLSQLCLSCQILWGFGWVFFCLFFTFKQQRTCLTLACVTISTYLKRSK